MQIIILISDKADIVRCIRNLYLCVENSFIDVVDATAISFNPAYNFSLFSKT